MIDRKDFHKCIVIGSGCIVAFLIMLVLAICSSLKSRPATEPFRIERDNLTKTIKEKQSEVKSLDDKITDCNTKIKLLENAIDKYNIELSEHGDFSSFEIDKTTVYCFYSQAELYNAVDKYIFDNYGLVWPKNYPLKREQRWTKRTNVGTNLANSMTTYKVPYCFYETTSVSSDEVIYKYSLWYKDPDGIYYSQLLSFKISISY